MSGNVIEESTGGPPAGAPVGPTGARTKIRERKAWSVNGFLALAVALGALGYAGWLGLQVIRGLMDGGSVNLVDDLLPIAGYFVLAMVVFSSMSVIEPGQTKVLQFFGAYVGTVRKTGLRMVLPLTSHHSVSVRVHNFETHDLKVNDADGNPINIASIVVWQVADTAKATFAVEDYANFVSVQAESALRHVAMSHPYDNDASGVTLREDTDVISRELAEEVAERIVLAGLEVIEVRISSLAYAPEIAQAMLQRQQASAVIAAREKIVEGAVGMVQGALQKLEEQGVVELDAERRAAMVSNLLVVLCSERGTTPMINAGEGR